MNISELFDMEDLENEIKEGYVKKTLHPTLPLGILNYTEKATFDRRWNQVTRHCRGLIYRLGSGKLIARGPVKFFNYGEPSAVQYPLDTPVRVSRKEDGSLGIGWYYEYGDDWHWGLATRGSFTSPQAEHATRLVQFNEENIGHYEVMSETLEHYHSEDWSYIGEIVFPENRIVLDYAGKDVVIPLGTVDNLTGLIDWRPFGFMGSKAESVITLAEALALPIPEGEEGYVLDILGDAGKVIDHLKLKGEWYKEMHAAIFHLTEKSVWEAWCNGQSAYFIQSLPDELQEWANSVADRLEDEWHTIRGEVFKAFAALIVALGRDASRKDQAQYILKHDPELATGVFCSLDGDYEKLNNWINKLVKPAHVPYAVYSTIDA